MKFAQCCLLAAALASASSTYALQAMSDTDLSGSTGQDGVDITMQDLNVSVNYIRWGSSGTTNSTYSGAADLQLAGFGVSALSPIDLQMRLGTSSAGQAAVVLTLSPTQLQFNPATVSVSKWSGVQSDLVANTDQQAVAGSGMFNLDLGTWTLPTLSLSLTQGMTNQLTGTQVSSSGITLSLGAVSKIDIANFGIQTSTAEQAAGNNAYMLHASDIAINNLGAMNISIGALSGAAATAAGLTGNAAANGALWISTSPITIGSVSVTNLGMGNASSSIGNFSLTNLTIGAMNTYISAIK